MKTKAVIWRKDRTNDVVVLKPKQIDANIFKYNNCAYLIDPECVQITWDRKYGWKRYYATLYYVEGVAKPAPVPHFNGAETLGPDGKKTRTFPKVVNLGVPSAE